LTEAAQSLLPRPNVLRGVLLMLGAALLFPVMNAFVKYLSADYSPVQIIWARNIGHLVFVLALFMPRFGWRLLVARKPKPQLVRSGLQLCSTSCYFVAVGYIPLAEAASISFTGPLIVTALSVPLLGENVGWRRWTAVAVGFAGALIVLRPGGEFAHWAALLCLGSPFCYAMYQIITRQLASHDRPETSVVYGSLVGTAATSLLVPFWWAMPTGWIDLALFLSLGPIAGLGHYLVAQAFRFGPASIIAPFNYGQLLGAVLFGYFLFGDLPSQWTWLGSGVILASGLYIAWREARLRAQSR
jgi:drug/metabolite transporter (DMT)-like permease